MGEILGHDLWGRWTAEVGVRDEEAGETVQGAVIDTAYGALFLLVLAAERGRVLWWAEGEVDGAEALFDDCLHERVWGTHDHGGLLLLWWLGAVTVIVGLARRM